jgi:small subunit ribosomal protein S21
MQREGIFREMKLRGHYEKPSEKKTREKAEAIRRARKLARKKMQRPRLVPGAPGRGFPEPPSLIEASELCKHHLRAAAGARGATGTGV